MQIKSDVLDLPYCMVNHTEVGTWGCAIIAGLAAGIFSDIAVTAKKYTVITERVEPRPSTTIFTSLMPNCTGKCWRDTRKHSKGCMIFPRMRGNRSSNMVYQPAQKRNSQGVETDV